MKPRSYHCWTKVRDRQARPGRRRPASTLIEVLAGLVVLGTLLVSVAITRGRFMRQWSDADKRLQATQAADAQLAIWLATPKADVPVPAVGPLDGAPGFSWRTSFVRDPAAGLMSATIVRMQVFETRSPAKAPIFSVDFLRHVYPPPKPATAPGADLTGKIR